METNKIDHSKDEYYLSYSLVDLEHEEDAQLDYKEQCPLDNKKIKDGYIECKSTGRRINNSDNMKFKCFTLHSIFNGKDIVNYTYGGIGYDLNPDSINVFAGHWIDYGTNNELNKIIDNKNIPNGKFGGLYIDHHGKVHETMHKKLINRAKALQSAIKNNNLNINNDKFKDDDSFNAENYVIDNNDRSLFNQLQLRESDIRREKALQEANIKYIPSLNNFSLYYNNVGGQYTPFCPVGNELNCTARDPKKGIKVDRIFVLEEKLTDLQKKQNGEDKYKGIYDRYINKLTDVLIQQFPFGEIRVVKGNIFTGQTNVFLSPEEFINQYFVNEKDKQHYLQELDKIRKSKTYQYGQKEPNNHPYGQKGYQQEGNNCCQNGCICF